MTDSDTGIMHVRASDAAERLREEAGERCLRFKRAGLGQCRNCPHTAHFRVAANNEIGHELYCAKCLGILHGHGIGGSNKFVEEAESDP